jgi:plastocyanin
MSGNSFTQVFGGTTIYPSDVSYLALTLSADTMLEWPLEATAGNNLVARIIDVTPTGVFTIFMPDATQVSVGQTVLFNNLGPNIVTVDTAAGNAILSMNPGEQWQIYLTDNTTVAGTWRTFRYGAATAQAQASALAGPGIVALGSVLAQNAEVVDFSSTPVTVTTADRAKTFVWTGALGTLVLPTAVSATDGWFINLRNSGSGDLVVDPAGSESINGASTLTLQPGDSASIVTDGVQWYTIGLGQQAVFAFDYTSVAVTGGTYTLSGSELNRIAYKFTGALSSNVTVVVPATVQQYWINNATTGSYTLSVLAAGSASPVVVAQNTTGIYYCDGTNIIAATTAAAFAGVVGISQGGTGATTAPSALTNLGGTGIGTSVFTAATTAAARTAIAAAASGANSDITSLTGLTTPLSVAQGGTGSSTAAGARTNLGAAASGSNSDITALTASGGIQIGAPTGGAQGTGTINATGLFINGVGVGTGSGSVTSVGMTVPAFLSVTGSPVTTSGTLAVSLSGTALPVANGGTGQTSYTDGQLLIGNSAGNTLTKSTLTAGSGISITNGGGSITISSTAGSGTVTSVSGSGGTTGLTLTGGPITTSGTLTIGGTLAVASGGTGAATASGARLNLGAAASGANSDITSLSNLSTPLSIAQGGTGASTAAGARSAISAAASGANSDITALSGLTTALSVGQGGTGSTTASGARTNLGATSIGASMFTLADPSAVTFPRFNADNTISALDAASFRTAIGAGTSSTTGTVTSVSGTGSANGLSLSGTVTTSGNITLSGSVTSVATGATIDGVTIGYRNIPRSTTSGTATTGDVGKVIAVSAGITIPNATFAAGDAVSIYNDSASSVTITQGASLTLRQAGTTNTGNRTLAARGMATIWFNGASEAIISGAGVS